MANSWISAAVRLSGRILGSSGAKLTGKTVEV